MILQGKVGPPSGALAVDSNPALRIDRTGAVITSLIHGDMFEAANNETLFVVANQAAVATTAAMATTWTGLLVGNPTTSSKDLVMRGFGYANTVAVPTATVIGLMTGTGATATASLTPRNRKVGASGASAAVANAAQTLPGTPVLEQVFSSAGTVATTGQGSPMTWVKLDGSMILTPGAFVATYSFAANTAAWIFAFLWEEVVR